MAPRRCIAGPISATKPTTAASTATVPAAKSGSTPTQLTQAAALELARLHVDTFAAPQDGRGALVVGVTLLLWVGSFCLGSWWFRHAQLNTWWGLALSMCWVFLRAGSLVRTFVIMHDAIHGALFSKRWLNNWTGIISGVMTGMDAPDYWRRHVTHHALLGIEEEVHRDPELIILWTTKEWHAWPRGLSKAAARVMCDPLILHTVMAPVWILAFKISWPHRVAHHSGRARLAYVAGKLLVLPWLYSLCLWVVQATPTLLMVELLSQQICLSYAMFLYNVEHTYEGVYRVPKAEFNRTSAGLLGSSYM